MAEERLQKLIAGAGLASRRKAEELILAGRVRVDGRIVRELGTRADPRSARIEVDGKRLVADKPLYVVLNKPRGVVSTQRDPEGRETVAALVRGLGTRVVSVGRLDYNTSGVLLLTNDGEFANRLLHPSSPSAKTYVVKVKGVVDEAGLEAWRRPIVIDGRRTQPAQVRRVRLEGDKSWLEVTLFEGRNRQIHRLGEATGFRVMRLERVRFAGIGVEGLAPGAWRHLTRDELVALKRTYGVPRSVQAGARSAARAAPNKGTGGGTARSGGRPRKRGGRRAEAASERAEPGGLEARGKSGSPHVSPETLSRPRKRSRQPRKG